ncbi:MAG TPA: hypothetical protein VFV08_15735 [Puia sp.]|nr:hypothetical protein [Puia sp.]
MTMIIQKENKFAYRCMIFAGILLVLASLIRAININNLIIAGSTGDIGKHYEDSVVIDSSLSSFLLLLVAIWIFSIAPGIKKRKKNARNQGLLIGLPMIFFSGGFWYKYHSFLDLPVFLVVGLLISFPLILYSGRFEDDKKSKGPDNSPIEKPEPRL